MQFLKRISLFLVINFLIVLTVSAVLSFFNVRPYLTRHGIDYRALLIFCLVWGMAGAFISLGLSRLMARWVMGVRVLQPGSRGHLNQEEEWLYQTVHRLSEEAYLPAHPQVGIFESAQLNAFATGPTRKRSLVAVSRGLLSEMSRDEIEGVLAHEISHIKSGDMVTMTLLQGIVNAFVMFGARVLAFLLTQRGKNNNNRSFGNNAGYVMLTFVFQILFMILGSMVVAFVSRKREFSADRGSALLVGKEKMILALRRLQIAQLHTPSRKWFGRHEAETKTAFRALMINNSRGALALFATHPSLDERIAHLEKL
ncbi:MAG: Protease HtpX [Chlamydiia bacterium]|nr:Protease HtpX [Chlamydiia bacterium]